MFTPLLHELLNVVDSPVDVLLVDGVLLTIPFSHPMGVLDRPVLVVRLINPDNV